MFHIGHLDILTLANIHLTLIFKWLMDFGPFYPGDKHYAAYLRNMPDVWRLRTWLQDLSDLQQRRKQSA